MTRAEALNLAIEALGDAAARTSPSPAIVKKAAKSIDVLIGLRDQLPVLEAAEQGASKPLSKIDMSDLIMIAQVFKCLREGVYPSFGDTDIFGIIGRALINLVEVRIGENGAAQISNAATTSGKTIGEYWASRADDIDSQWKY